MEAKVVTPLPLPSGEVRRYALRAVITAVCAVLGVVVFVGLVVLGVPWTGI